jgi:hypothetical protein
VEHCIQQHLQVYQNLLIVPPLPTKMRLNEVVILFISIFGRFWPEPYVSTCQLIWSRALPPISPLINLLGKTIFLPCSDAPPPPNIYTVRIARDYPCNSLCRISIKNMQMAFSNPERMPSPCTVFTESSACKMETCPSLSPLSAYILSYLPFPSCSQSGGLRNHHLRALAMPCPYHFSLSAFSSS